MSKFIFLQRVTITENFCGADPKLNTPIEGNMSLYSNPVLTYNDVNITAVAMAVIEEHTVAFLGTYTGHLKKVSYYIGNTFQSYI